MENQDNNKIAQNNSESIEEFDDPLSQPGRIFLAEIDFVNVAFYLLKLLD